MVKSYYNQRSLADKERRVRPVTKFVHDNLFKQSFIIISITPLTHFVRLRDGEVQLESCYLQDRNIHHYTHEAK